MVFGIGINLNVLNVCVCVCACHCLSFWAVNFLRLSNDVANQYDSFYVFCFAVHHFYDAVANSSWSWCFSVARAVFAVLAFFVHFCKLLINAKVLEFYALVFSLLPFLILHIKMQTKKRSRERTSLNGYFKLKTSFYLWWWYEIIYICVNTKLARSRGRDTYFARFITLKNSNALPKRC